VKTYHILNWDATYETYKSRSVDRQKKCSIPTKQNGVSYRRMVREHLEFYGVFVALALLCAKQFPASIRDGWLTVDGKQESEPLLAEDISDKTGIETKIIESALKYFCSDRIGWIEEVET